MLVDAPKMAIHVFTPGGSPLGNILVPWVGHSIVTLSVLSLGPGGLVVFLLHRVCLKPPLKNIASQAVVRESKRTNWAREKLWLFFFFLGCRFVGGFIYKSAVTALHLWGTVLTYLQVCQPCLGCGNKLAQLWMNEHTHTHIMNTHT